MILKRIAKLRQALRRYDGGPLEGALFFQPEQLHYFSGFSGSTGALIVFSKAAILFVDSRYLTQAKEEVPKGVEVKLSKGLLKSVVHAVTGDRVKRLGVHEGTMTVSLYHRLQKGLREVTLLSLDQIERSIRVIKDKEEIAKLREAARITDVVYREVVDLIRPGVRELDLAAELEYRMRLHGAEGSSFPPIVASGFRSALPHGLATPKKVNPGEYILFDFGVLYQGYHSDQTRVVVLGRPTEKQKKIYQLVRQAQEKAMAKVKAGVTCGYLDQIAREDIVRAGYGSRFGHSLGHGVGLEIHEAPTVATQSQEVLTAGMVITVEPGIYLPGWGGVRIEDMLWVKPHGYEVLTTAPKDLLVL